MATNKEFKLKEIGKSDVLMMASEIVSNDKQLVVIYSRPESGKTVVMEKDYVFNVADGYYKETTPHYYKTSSGVRNSTDNYLSLDEENLSRFSLRLYKVKFRRF